MTLARDFCRECTYAWRLTCMAMPRGTGAGWRYFLGVVVQAAVDLGIFWIALATGFQVVTVHICSFMVAAAVIQAVIAYGLKSRLSGSPVRYDMTRFIGLSLIVALMVLFLRGGVLAFMTQVAGWPAQVAIIPLAVLSSSLMIAGMYLLDCLGPGSPVPAGRRWHVLAFGVIVYSIALRIAYMPSPNLIPEEAYYWNYAQHLDWGYLDHPPMVAWIIKLGSISLGNTEFGVRIGAMVCWLVAAGFGYGFARELLGRRTAVGVVFVMSALPFFFGIGCIMTPDAPLTACWAGALFFLGRALLRERPGAWVAAGVCIGLGMLSKYTIGLLIPATVLFVLIDGRSRRWLARPQPYIACIVAAVLFSPVVYWNAMHNWASFVFQTARRMNEVPIFSLHTLLGEIMLLLTPTALAGVAAVLIAHPLLGMRFARTAFTQRTRLFLLALTLTPLAVVTVFSLTHEPKLNWTGPTWLAVLPFVAWVMAPAQKDRCGAFVSAIRRSWMPTIISMMLLSGAVFHFLTLGFPGIPYPKHISDIAGWKDLQWQIAGIESATRSQTGTIPLIVGMDRYNISSELAFYGAPDGPSRTAGRNLLGQNGLMYGYWFAQSEQSGKPIIAVAREQGPLESDRMASRFDSLSQLGTLPVSLNGHAIGQYYYRVGFGYRATPDGR